MLLMPVGMSAQTSLPAASLAFRDPDCPHPRRGHLRGGCCYPCLHRTARATSCPLQLPSEDGPAQRSWVWMGCAEAVPPIPRWVTASLPPDRCVMASLDRGECYVLPNIPQWRTAPHSPIKFTIKHNIQPQVNTLHLIPTHSPKNYPEPLGT